MSCTYDSIKQLFKKASISVPRSAKFERLLRIFANNGFCHPDKRVLDAETQAKLLCVILNDLEEKFFAHTWRSCSRFAFVFVHPKNGTKGEHAFGHCLAIHSCLYEGTKRFCAVEDNWRSIRNLQFGFRFRDRDWATSLPPRLMEKPFEFSFFITADGYSTYVKPRKVLNTMEKGIVYDHDHKYSPRWEKI